MATTNCEPDPESSSCSLTGTPIAQSPKRKATSVDQLSLVVGTNKHTKAQGLKSLFVEKVRGVKEFGHRLNKLGRHLSASDQSELATGPRLLSVSSLDPESDLPRLVRTNAFKVSCCLDYCVLIEIVRPLLVIFILYFLINNNRSNNETRRLFYRLPPQPVFMQAVLDHVFNLILIFTVESHRNKIRNLILNTRRSLTFPSELLVVLTGLLLRIHRWNPAVTQCLD